MIAALFVQKNGAYFGLPDVDPWDEARDARLYAGPHPVVAHPPCERWGRYWFGGPSVKVRRKRGDDGGCFLAALNAVRRFGGVLEHPAASSAFAAFGLPVPPASGGWQRGVCGGWSCHVEQGHYGHKARKATWLYVVGVELPHLRWGPSDASQRLDEGFHTAAERRTARAAGVPPRKRLTTRDNLATPPQFRDLLLSIARSTYRMRDAA